MSTPDVGKKSLVSRQMYSHGDEFRQITSLITFYANKNLDLGNDELFFHRALEIEHKYR